MKIADWLQSVLGVAPDTQSKLLLSVTVLGVLVFLRWFVLRVVHRRTDDVGARYRARKATTYISFLLGILFIGRIWFVVFRDVGTFLGLLSAGLAIALKDLVASIAGWAYLLSRRPFESATASRSGIMRATSSTSVCSGSP